jgi:hypothetical protein
MLNYLKQGAGFCSVIISFRTFVLVLMLSFNSVSRQVFAFPLSQTTPNLHNQTHFPSLLHPLLLIKESAAALSTVFLYTICANFGLVPFPPSGKSSIKCSVLTRSVNPFNPLKATQRPSRKHRQSLHILHVKFHNQDLTVSRFSYF